MKTVNEELRNMSAKIEKLERENDSLKSEVERQRNEFNLFRHDAGVEIVRLTAENAQLRLENARLMLVGNPTKADYIIRTSNNSNDLEGGEG